MESYNDRPMPRRNVVQFELKIPAELVAYATMYKVPRVRWTLPSTEPRAEPTGCTQRDGDGAPHTFSQTHPLMHVQRTYGPTFIIRASFTYCTAVVE